MNSGADSGEAVVRLALQGTVFLLKISGQATATVLSFLAATTSEKSKVSGKVRLKRLLQSGSDLKVFTVQGDENFKDFIREAKRYGMLFSVVKRTRNDKDTEVYDIMVRTEDASKLNRIIEKNHMAEVEATARSVSPEETEQTRIMEVRELLSKMLDQDTGRNPDQALEVPSRSNALSRMPNQANRSSVVKEMESYIEERRRAVEPKAPEAVMPNIMEDLSEEKEENRENTISAESGGESAKALISEMLAGEALEPGREV